MVINLPTMRLSTLANSRSNENLFVFFLSNIFQSFRINDHDVLPYRSEKTLKFVENKKKSQYTKPIQICVNGKFWISSTVQ